MATPIQVVFDCADPARLSAFWAEALGYKRQDPPTGFGSWEEFLTFQGVPQEEWNSASAVVDPEGVGPRIFFQRVPEAKAVKNRVHLDVNAGEGHDTSPEERQRRMEAAVERLAVAGAAKVEARGRWGQRWVVMQDPEGNEFCVQ
jgi:catechol 2,3-dioxygenase-like lactoylglutathione lyase family enzyme